MTQPTGPGNDLDIVMRGYMVAATLCTAATMFVELISTIIPQARDQLIQAVRHDLTREDWEDYWQSWGEKMGNPKCLQRAEDREKIRRLVFGKDDGSGS